MLDVGAILARRFQVLRPLGQGAASSTFLAHDQTRDDHVALKVLRRDDPALLTSLRREFVALSGRYHPHLIHVRDLFYGHDAPPFYTADYVDGVTLTRWSSGRTWDELRGPIAHVLDALQFLHRLGLRHGDIKPDNILVDANDQGTVIDLGCARPLEDSTASPCGTPSFMAPEVLAGKSADARADLYALGATLQALGTRLPRRVSDLARRLTQPAVTQRPTDALEVAEALGLDRPLIGPPRGRHPELLGRHVELTAFREALASMLEDRPHPRCLFMRGRDGLGRTRLLQEMKWEAQQRTLVVEGWAQRQDSFAELLTRLLDGAGVDADVPSVLAARSRLLRQERRWVVVLDDVHAMDSKQRELLYAWLRVAQPNDPYLMLLTSRDAAPAAPSLRTLELGPLTLSDISKWAHGLVHDDAARHVLRLTGGVAADVESMLVDLMGGGLRESDIATAGPEVVRASGVRLDELEAHDRRTLAILSLGSFDDGRLRQLEAAEPSRMARLQRDGWVLRDGDEWRLARTADGAVVLQSLGRTAREELHRDVAVTVTNDADRAYHLAMAGELERAESLLERCESEVDAAPQRFRRVAEAIGRRSKTSGVLCARVHRLCGDVPKALETLTRVLRGRPDRSTRAACRTEAAACYLASGDLTRAVRAVRRGLSDDPSDWQRAALLDVGCRVLVHQGTYERVVADATKGLSMECTPAIRARLLESLGVASAYLGRGDRAREALREASELQAQSPRDLVRVHSYQAILAYREGNLAEAVDGYTRALEVAEQNGLADHMATTAMNLGTAHQQRGDWGRALESYERGLRLARALGKDNTRRTLLLNLANLYAGIGSLDRADELIAELRRDASGLELGYMSASIVALVGELALARGQGGKADHEFVRARAMFEEQGAQREVREMDLQRTSAALAEGRVEDAHALLEAVSDATLPVDVGARCSMRKAEVSLARNAVDEALDHARKAVVTAESSKQLALQAEAEGLLTDVYERRSARQLASDHRQAARRLWETIGVALPKTLQGVFFEHPLRAKLFIPAARDDTPARRSDRRDLVRILEINQRLNSSLSVDQVLARALDAAIELSSAERGFVLVRREGSASKKLEVAVARNVDRERVGRSHLKFSRSIAEKVIRSGEPVSTTDALSDDRFRSNASVHAMQLRSVVCVPVRAPEGVLGAIYLDHRFRREQFGGETIELLQAFANQVAIALRNARLHADLARRTAALQAEQERVQALLRGQAEEIDRLSVEVRTRQEALEFRYDYSSIVGNSAPMRELFRTLDRVTAADIDVLVQGDSGTGKELVARALHYNGGRRRQRFVSINCAAVPDELLESELFGVVRGAFTGADRDREGLVVTARGGTLFLDEVGEMSLSMQAKLLRVLQERKVRPLGGNREVDVDIRMVCATNRRLREEVDAGRFREDLYYRIGVVELSIPALRERTEDIPALCEYLLKRGADGMGRDPLPLRPDALRLVMRQPWPGNVRQLDNVLRRALVMADGDAIRVEDLDLDPVPRRRARLASDRVTFEKQEAQRILRALDQHRWNVSEVARALGIPRNTLYRKLKKYDIDRDRSGT